MNFAFLVHPLGNESDRMMGYLREVNLRRSFGRGLVSYFHDLHVARDHALQRDALGTAASVGVIDELSGLTSQLSAHTNGRLYEIPMNSFAILDDPHRALDYMLDAAAMAASWGARILGLGAMTGVIGGGGTYLAEHVTIPVTTGNSLTVYAAVANLLQACDEVGIDLADEDVAVIGVPGSIASAAARMLRSRCRSLVLAARGASARASALASELGAELVYDVRETLARARVVLSATSSGGCIEQAWLQPGTILSDIGVPTDVIGDHLLRPDVLILSGGLCMVPETMPWTSHYLWFHRGAMAACVAETVVLALDDAAESLSLGRNLDLGRIEAVGRRAEAHGFSFSHLFSFGQPIEDSALTEFRKNVARSNLRASRHAPMKDDFGQLALERYRRHVNPALVSVGGSLIKTFVKGEGCKVYDTNGRPYLDFLAGYGSLNLGHNHPEVAAAVQAALTSHAPGFSPAAVNPYAAALAEQLASLAPAGLEMVFFANSGAEAVEACLKIARRVSGRKGYVYCERSYHGKTLGSLSVTGNDRYQRPFEPLMPECTSVPFGDLEALAAVLATRRYAGFIVEPMQAEGGMIVPPDAYLPAAQELCRTYGTLLIADEVQTGLGRTGSLFAVDRLGVEPDLMALAKSLGGGLVPIGAMLARRDHWQKAYGNLETFALHTSTFGGGSLACAAGLATLDVLRREHLVENAAARGAQLLAGLEALAERYEIIRDVRGLGLLVGLEFNPPPESVVRLWQKLLVEGSSAFLVPSSEELMRSNTATWVMALLLEEYAIYTQTARSNPNVLRIEPPLVVSETEIASFLTALDECCAEVESTFNTLKQLIGKAILGRHGDVS